jgi:hypothetical protein
MDEIEELRIKHMLAEQQLELLKQIIRDYELGDHIPKKDQNGVWDAATIDALVYGESFYPVEYALVTRRMRQRLGIDKEPASVNPDSQQ